LLTLCFQLADEFVALLLNLILPVKQFPLLFLS